MSTRPLRIGCGAGYSGDRIEPAVELVERGDLDVIVFECLAERTIAIAQQAHPQTHFIRLPRRRSRAVQRVHADEVRPQFQRYDRGQPQPLGDISPARRPRAAAAARTKSEADARRVAREVEALFTNGPAGGGGAFTCVRPVLAIRTALVARDRVS